MILPTCSFVKGREGGGRVVGVAFGSFMRPMFAGAAPFLGHFPGESAQGRKGLAPRPMLDDAHKIPQMGKAFLSA